MKKQTMNLEKEIAVPENFRVTLRSVFALLILSTATASGQQLFFQTPKADACSGDGIRQWSAIIDGRGYSGDWVQACKITTATINGNQYPSRNCAWNGGRVWGQFDVKDQSCASELYFLAPQAGQCLATGKREFFSIIDGRNYRGDWVTACQNTSMTILGTSSKPTSCAWSGSRVLGRFEVPDSSCSTRVRGSMRYQDYRPDYVIISGSRSLIPSVERPIRRGRVEIWYGDGLGRTKQVVQTGDDGTFDTFVPTFPASNYKVVIVADNPAGQANWKDNTATWYWTRDYNLDRHVDGDGLFLAATVREPEEAMAFNAADVILAARDYAISHGVPAQRINRVDVVPQSSTVLTMRTTPSGAESLIWATVGKDDKNRMFDDGSILHEFGHHLERMNDTYALWPANHDGCKAEALGDVRSLEFAWFEGFPEYFSIVASEYFPFVTRRPRPLYNPKFTPCVPIPTEGPGAVENYVTSLLLDLVARRDIWSPSGFVPLTRDELESRVMNLWFNDMKTVRTPGNGMPRIIDFKVLWNRAFPNSSVLDSLMKAYGM